MSACPRSLNRAGIILGLLATVSGCTANPQERKLAYQKRGTQYLEKNQYENAAIEFRNALQVDKRFFDAYYELAKAELALHEWNAAAKAFDAAVELRPDRLDVRLARGQFYLAARAFPKAEEDARAVVEQDPGNAAAHQLLGASLAARQENADAADAFAKSAELSATDPAAFINLALAEVGLKRFADAEKHLEKAIELDSRSIRAYVDLATVLRLQKKESQSFQVLQRGVNANPDAIDLYVAWSDLLSSAGKKGDAEGVLDRLRKQAPGSAEAAAAIGNIYLRRNQPSQAVAEYNRGLALAPKDVALRKTLFDAYLAVGQIDRATALDQQLLKEVPQDTTVRMNHARLLTLGGASEEAIVELKRDAQEQPDSAQVHYALALAYWKHGELQPAREELDAALRIAPNLRAARKSSVELSLAQGDVAAAEKRGSLNVHDYPDDEPGHVALGVAYLRERKIASARNEFLIARQLVPSDPAAVLNLALIFQAEQQWAKAEEQLDVAWKLDPRSIRALRQYADYWTGRKQPEKAIGRVQQFVKAYPDVADASLLLGSLHLATRNYGAAQAAFERAIQLNPGQMDAYVRLGQLYQRQGQTRIAIARYEKALEIQPNQVPLCTLIGNLYLSDGNLDGARKYFERALALNPNFPVAAGNLAWIYVQQGANLDVALGLAQTAKRLLPDAMSVTDTLGWIMYKKGLTDGAVSLFRECVQKVPDSAQYHYHLGKALLTGGDEEQGRIQLETALRLKLDGTDAADARTTLAGH